MISIAIMLQSCAPLFVISLCLVFMLLLFSRFVTYCSKLRLQYLSQVHKRLLLDWTEQLNRNKRYCRIIFGFNLNYLKKSLLLLEDLNFKAFVLSFK